MQYPSAKLINGRLFLRHHVGEKMERQEINLTSVKIESKSQVVEWPSCNGNQTE